ncbi:MAG: DNA translocase FtsK 4TM domain-containing protein [Candidatus Paceibacterota bacterium]
MAKKKKKKKDEASFWSFEELKEETRHGIVAVGLIVISVFFLLSGLNYAGPAGNFTFGWLEKVFGAGYFLLPLMFFVLGMSFLKAVKPNFLLHRIVGGLVFFVAGLGLLTTLAGNGTGGWVGELITSPLLSLFDIYVSVIFLLALLIISLLVLFDTPLKLGFLFKKSDEEKVAPEKELKITGQADDSEEEEGENKKNTEKKSEAEPAKNLVPSFISFGRKESYGNFAPPPLSLLEKDSGKPGAGDIKANSNIIKRTLANFGIQVEMDEISIGPSVTRYALKPAEGIKLSRILGLQNDLALALAAHPLRIEAPIPGKSLVGIEIPNSIKSTIGLASLLGNKSFANSPEPLLVALGKGIAGNSFFGNLAKAPHLLIAGATGSGKSVTIHALITSLLYRNPPDKLRFIMIDPKRVELTLYKKIPHLLTPVITDAKKAILALKWAAKEMERRYNILEDSTVRDISSYHQNILAPQLAKVAKKESDEEDNDIERMPYIVIVIDELADIMSSYPRELEAAIVRLAQMSRAVGIHLILSTQRPSVEVITGLIKANMPTRVALQVSSQIDSRTILDMAGAEKLLGAGDMLYMSGDMAKPVRVQSAFISETEVKKVTDYLAGQYEDEIPSEINLDGEHRDSALFGTALDGTGDDDELYEDAREAVVSAGKASASYLQRKLKVGYARAARLLDMLEERGVIGPGEGAKPRDVYDSKPTATDENPGDTDRGLL